MASLPSLEVRWLQVSALHKIKSPFIMTVVVSMCDYTK